MTTLNQRRWFFVAIGADLFLHYMTLFITAGWWLVVVILGMACVSFALWLDWRIRRTAHAEDWYQEGNIRPQL